MMKTTSDDRDEADEPRPRARRTQRRPVTTTADGRRTDHRYADEEQALAVDQPAHVVLIAVIALGATLAAGWSPKLGLDLEGGLSVVYKTHAGDPDQLNTVVTILNERVERRHQRGHGRQPGQERDRGLDPR